MQKIILNGWGESGLRLEPLAFDILQEVAEARLVTEFERKSYSVSLFDRELLIIYSVQSPCNTCKKAHVAEEGYAASADAAEDDVGLE